jgi:hypothetical protein
MKEKCNKKVKKSLYFEIVKGRYLKLLTKICHFSPYLQPEFEVRTSSGFRVIRKCVQNLYRLTGRKRSEIGHILI